MSVRFRERSENICRNAPLILETPAGPIEIRQADGNRRILLRLPTGVRVFKNMTHLAQSGQFLNVADDGRVLPRFSMLVPVLNEQGEFEGLSAPKMLRIKPG